MRADKFFQDPSKFSFHRLTLLSPCQAHHFAHFILFFKATVQQNDHIQITIQIKNTCETAKMLPITDHETRHTLQSKTSS